MGVIVAPMSGVPYALQSAQTTGNGDVVTPPPSFRNHTFQIKAAAGVNAGAIQIESSDDPTYSGTWAQVGGGPVAVVASAEVTVNVTGVYTALRARISTTIAGGAGPSVTVSYLGAKSY